MPIPTPTENEQEGEFIVRCMADETMRDEYPDRQQRLAICYGEWRKKDDDSEDTTG